MKNQEAIREKYQEELCEMRRHTQDELLFLEKELRNRPLPKYLFLMN